MTAADLAGGVRRAHALFDAERRGAGLRYDKARRDLALRGRDPAARPALRELAAARKAAVLAARSSRDAKLRGLWARFLSDHPGARPPRWYAAPGDN